MIFAAYHKLFFDSRLFARQVIVLRHLSPEANIRLSLMEVLLLCGVATVSAAGLDDPPDVQQANASQLASSDRALQRS